MGAPDVTLFLAAAMVLLLAVSVILLAVILVLRRHPPYLARAVQNPVLAPGGSWWESEAVFNPAAFVYDGAVHLFYRAIGRDGVSRIGYAKSGDGIHFERRAEPAYDPSQESVRRAALERRVLSYNTLTYDTVSYASGGGWGGSEDPRAVVIDNEVLITFTSFEGWNNVRMMLATLPLSLLDEGLFSWSKGVYLSRPNEIQKNWVLFPEKIRGRYALLHNIDPDIEIAYFDPAHVEEEGHITSRFERAPRKRGWDTRIRGAGAPPLKTKEGWLLFYHAIDEREPHKYKVGAMLLDLKNPKKILYRSNAPVLEPQMWYENDWKPGIVYLSGAVIFGDDVLVYYGGGDKYVAVARHNLDDFLYKLTHNQHATLEPAV
jgi:beta-1,2-mannobiose phosphorylase / 1,2-beta-oligomannan phosphorylase